MDLSPIEISLIKGLHHHKNFNQQRILTYFSRPDRTVHANLVSQIIGNRRYEDVSQYPVASAGMCELFLSQWQRHENSDWALFYAELGRAPQEHDFAFSYRYHPVGQGGFCSGQFTRRRNAPFRWVYDCGVEHGCASLIHAEHVRREILQLANEQTPLGDNVPHIDLLTLSHFDEDHLSGITDLISTFTVGTVLLPYLTPWQRLVVALERNAAVGSDLLAFLIAPTDYLLTHFEDRIARVLLVPGSSGEEALPPGAPGVPEGEDRGGRQRYETEKNPEEAWDQGFGTDGGFEDPKVATLRAGAALTVDRAWEFVPYNDARLASSVTTAFKKKASPLATIVRDHARPRHDREAALKSLQALYDLTFKSPNAKTISSRRRNEISLFLYAGPIGRVMLDSVSEKITRHRLDPVDAVTSVSGIGDDRFGQMFTGDGYLKTQRQWESFSTFFGAHRRLHRAGFFQVMHHGARANWHCGVAAKLTPKASIFNSNPAGHLRHPHEEVLLDFAAYNPRQIDAFHGWQVQGKYRLLS